MIRRQYPSGLMRRWAKARALVESRGVTVIDVSPGAGSETFAAGDVRSSNGGAYRACVGFDHRGYLARAVCKCPDFQHPAGGAMLREVKVCGHCLALALTVQAQRLNMAPEELAI